MKTRDLNDLTAQTSSIYEAVVILSKRARQISADEKAELETKLSYYEGFGPEMEDARMAEEQARVSVEFEKRPKPTETAIEQMLDHEVYFRYTDQEG